MNFHYAYRPLICGYTNYYRSLESSLADLLKKEVTSFLHHVNIVPLIILTSAACSDLINCLICQKGYFIGLKVLYS